MNDFRFKSLEDLYNRVKPALSTKKHDLERCNVNYVDENDIWDYLRFNSWNNRANLTLGEMVNEILNTPNIVFQEYKLKHMKENNDELL